MHRLKQGWLTGAAPNPYVNFKGELFSGEREDGMERGKASKEKRMEAEKTFFFPSLLLSLPLPERSGP